jgi:hypothetical protein
MSIISEFTGTKTYQSKSGYRVLEEDEEDGEDKNDEKKLKFTSNVISHTSKEIKFQMTFENSFLVSEKASKYDRFQMRISKAYLFRSKKHYKTVSTYCEEKNCFIDFDIAIPPQI